ncbi:MAG: NADH-quinone oxidoreductase subunit H [Deltaproteobacteria bacterium]|nr:NADH-quinone oxidoreductase subunit H [Deltaproteobacteria bacterium]
MTAMLFFSSLACLTLAIGAGRHPRLWLTLVLCGAVGVLTTALGILGHAEAWTWRAAFTLGGETPNFFLDGVSAVFLIVVSLVGGLSAIYSREYWSDRQYPASAARGRSWGAVLILGMVLVPSLANGLHFLLAWEVFAISAYFLITLDNTKSEVRRAGWLYLAASHVGTMFLFAFFTALAAQTGSWDLGPMRDQTALAPLFWLALVGFGVKAGMFPLHIWLPSAHANAPSHVSAMMSAVAIKMGVYGIVRYSSWLPLPDGAGWIVLTLGITSALLGIAFALAQNDFKRLLAYCSVENVGIILTGLGLAILAQTHGQAAWGRIALCGALLHVWNHGLFKALLFFGAGSVLHATGTRDMSRLGGLWRAMPWTTGLFAMGAAAVSGLPPLNGFVSEWIIYLGLIKSVMTKGDMAQAIIPVVILLAAAGALALAAFAKAMTIIFLGAPRTKPAITAHECGWTMRAPMLVLAGLMAGIGLFPTLVLAPIGNAASAWSGNWTEIPAMPVADLGQFHLVLFAVLIALAAAFMSKVRLQGLRFGPTWDCGYAAPTARMQYSGGSFAGIATEWFAWILRPSRLVRRVRGHFPEQALALERIPETVLEKAIQPVSTGVVWLADGAKKMQHGRLHIYILYVFAGVMILGALAFWGGIQ